MKLSTKAALVAAAVAVAAGLGVLAYFLITSMMAPPSATEGSDAPAVIRPNSHVLDEGAEGSPTVVEFLDFECEACGAFYPIVEAIREQYSGDLNYVVRYFPLEGHFNSMNAALAAEAAAQQGSFEEMYHRLFQSQAEWGEAKESRADLFRSFAEELNLDMEAYDAAVADPDTQTRVEQDFNEGRALGVRSTPTFFIDGQQLQLERWEDLPTAIEEAVGKTMP